MATANAGAPPVTIGDTKLKDELLRAEKEERRLDALSDAERAAEEDARAVRTGITHVDLESGYSPLPDVEENNDPKSEMVIVRFRRAVDEMAYGRAIVAPAVYDGDGNLVKPAVLGGIRYFSFTEGRRYEIPRSMAEHLFARGIVYDYE